MKKPDVPWSLMVILAATFVCAVSSVGAAEQVKIFVFAAPERPADTFLGGMVSAALTDSVNDIRSAISSAGWRANTKKRDEAAVFVQVIGREETNGEFRVHARVTTHDGREADLTGTSTRRWSYAATQLVSQLMTWIKANEASLLQRR